MDVNAHDNILTASGQRVERPPGHPQVHGWRQST